MGIYLKIGEVDVSRFITVNKYSCTSQPVYDEENGYISIYGEKIRKRTGHEVTISAFLSDVDDGTAAALSAAAEQKKCQVTYSAPDEKTGDFECLKLALSLDRVYRGEKFWSAELKLYAPFVAEDGL